MNKRTEMHAQERHLFHPRLELWGSMKGLAVDRTVKILFGTIVPQNSFRDSSASGQSIERQIQNLLPQTSIIWLLVSSKPNPH
jgi:hypothetical protein